MAEQAHQLERITQALLAMSSFDFSAEIPVRGTRDALDELAQAARMLQAELGTKAVPAAHLNSLLAAIPSPLAVLEPGGRAIAVNSLMQHLLEASNIREPACWMTTAQAAEGARPEPGCDQSFDLSGCREPVQVALAVAGVEQHYEFSVSPLRSPRDVVEGYVMVGTNQSEQVKLERELQRARDLAEAHSQARVDFLANISHEIRTPLQGILGSVELLMSQIASAPELGMHARTIQACGKHLLGLVEGILDFSQIRANRIALEEHDFDLPGLLRDSLASIEPSHRREGVAARVSLAPDLPRQVRGDPERLRQVLEHLLANAFKFTHEGEVELRASVVARPVGHATIRIEVRDTGVGIAADKQESIFAPFEQGDTSITRQYGGTGLGLAVVRRLVNLMQGRVGVESTPGQGSTFWLLIELPLMRVTARTMAAQEPSQEPAGEAEGERAGAASQLEGTRVLLVEDNLVSQRLVALMLQQAGAQVTVAGHGAEALDRLDETQFDVVLMDCQMPVMDGLTATRELRRREGERRTPVIALTADAFEIHRQRCLEAGMDDYLRKPVRRVILCQTIREHLANR